MKQITQIFLEGESPTLSNEEPLFSQISSKAFRKAFHMQYL